MSKSVVVRAGQIEFLKVNAGGWEWRDAYHWLLALSWPRFAALILGVYIAINLIFAGFYSMGGDCIAGMEKGSFSQAFFFSVQTLATVGYGHMYPETVYGHIVTIVEIMLGVFWLAVMTGLIFVRFSRPKARIMFSKSMVIASFNGRPTLMLRVANLRHHSMVEAEFRITFTRDEPTTEGDTVRRFYPLKLDFDRIIIFPAALTVRHFIDEQSPLHGATPESLEACDAFFLASIVCVETVIPAAVQIQKDYMWEEIRFGERFVEIYSELPDGRVGVDYGRLHDTEPADTPIQAQPTT
jgi:inward rectifier potassium channel